jgi:GNAT superfamily N-acetyltransferase
VTAGHGERLVERLRRSPEADPFGHSCSPASPPLGERPSLTGSSSDAQPEVGRRSTKYLRREEHLRPTLTGPAGRTQTLRQGGDPPPNLEGPTPRPLVIRTTDAGEAAELQAAGARLVRHSHDMVLDLASIRPAPDWARPRPPTGLRLSGITGWGAGLGAASLMAYHPGHPDASGSLEKAQKYYEGLLAGESAGPLLEEASCVVTDTSGDTLAAAVVVTRLGPEPWGWGGGPWVADVFVVPVHQGRGLGRMLLWRAIARCHAAGELRIGLTVTEGNPAERLYHALGFRRCRTLFVLDAP